RRLLVLPVVAEEERLPSRDARRRQASELGEREEPPVERLVGMRGKPRLGLRVLRVDPRARLLAILEPAERVAHRAPADRLDDAADLLRGRVVPDGPHGRGARARLDLAPGVDR